MIRMLSLEEKKACIVYMIAILIDKTEDFICHCFSEFVKSETEMEFDTFDTPEDNMHVIFPELYNELKSLVEDDVDLLKYNMNDTRMGDYFSETHKCPIWFCSETEERINFLNDLNDTLK